MAHFTQTSISVWIGAQSHFYDLQPNEPARANLSEAEIGALSSARVPSCFFFWCSVRYEAAGPRNF
jgi:hypothetical protein